MRGLSLSAYLVALGFVLIDAKTEYGIYPAETSPAYLLRLSGFLADEIALVTKSGYVLRLTRGRNPLFSGRSIAGREPILFVHGVLCNANNFLLNSFGAQPKDLSGLDFKTLGLNETKRILQDEPSAKSLPLLALNRGHEVWLLSRRGMPGSQERLGDPLSIKAKPTNRTRNKRPRGNSHLVQWASSFGRLLWNQPRTLREILFGFDYKFWDYSLDQQSVDDFPLTIDYILNKTVGAKRLAVVAHSAGGALTLISLSQMEPKLRRRISVAILWAPSYSTDNRNFFFDTILKPLNKLAGLAQGPIPLWPHLVTPYISSMMLLCDSPRTWRTTCEHYYDKWFGPSGGKQPMRPQFQAFGIFLSSGHEMAQQGQQRQFPPNHTMHKFDYGPIRNMLEYGQLEPPAYNLSNLDNSTRYSFYSSPHDVLVRPADVDKTRSQLTIPSLHTVINNTLNHIGFFFHDDVQNLVVIPSMFEIELLARTL